MTMGNSIVLPGLAKTLNLGGAGSQSFNLFQVFGQVEVESLCAEVTTAFAAGLTPAYFEVWDNGASLSTALTLAAGGVVSSIAQGSFFAKCDAATVALTVLDASVGTALAIEHATNHDIFKKFIVRQKSAGGVTFIRFTYTAAGASSGVFIPQISFKTIGANSMVLPV